MAAVTSTTMMMTVILMMMMMMAAVRVEAQATNQNQNKNQEEAEQFLKKYDGEAQEVKNHLEETVWTFVTNLTFGNYLPIWKSYERYVEWRFNSSQEASQFDTTNFPSSIKRQMEQIRDIGVAALGDADERQKLEDIASQLYKIYAYGNISLTDYVHLYAWDIRQIFETHRDEGLLRFVWLGWRDATGKEMRQLYPEFVKRNNDAMKLLGYEDEGEYWRKARYEKDDLEAEVADMWGELEPLYRQMHAFVRHRLKAYYPENLFPASGHIPAHLTGHLSGEYWNNIQDLTMPFPAKPYKLVDVSAAMVQQGYTPETIFKMAENFFTSMGLEELPQSFWDNSMLEKPKDGRRVVCYPMAWDFYNGVDYRINQCTKLTIDDFITAHHLMGSIMYYREYKDQPVVFRKAANPALLDAIGDVILLSVENPNHLHKVGLLDSVQEDEEVDVNFLMITALQTLAYLPYGHVLSSWRWGVYRGDITPDHYNQEWWKRRCDIQGLSPPVERTEDDFDPGADHNVAHNDPSIEYFIGYVIQYQIHEVLCKAAGHTGPLHACDIYNSKKAGEKLRALMSVGSSQPWTVPFEKLTGQKTMSAQPMLNYFQPLMKFLKKYNQENNVRVGWDKGCPQFNALESTGDACFPSSLVVAFVMGLVIALV